MSWTESLYHRAEAWLKTAYERKQGLRPTDASVSFEEMKSILNGWAALLSARTWSLQESEGWPSVDDDRLCFPPVIEIFSSRELNRKSYLYICSYLLEHDERTFPELKNWRDEFARDAAIEQASDFARARLLEPSFLSSYDPTEVPFSNENHDGPSFKNPAHLWTVVRLKVTLNRRDAADAGKDERSQVTTEKVKKGRQNIEIVDGLNDAETENPLVHSFEKLHTTEDYNGGNKQKDGEDELQEHSDSLDELDLRQVIRSTQAASSRLKGDYAMDIDVAESESQNLTEGNRVFLYDEWNESKKTYLSNWCRVEETRPSAERTSALDIEALRRRNRRQIEDLTRCLFSLFKAPKWASRQSEGIELDLDAVVDLLACPPEHRGDKLNVYMNRRKDIQELAVVVLFDRSLSSDSWINERRVLDVTKESIVISMEALRGFPIDVEVASFGSLTRNRVSYDLIKGFDENWKMVSERLGGIEPAGYTRIGPVLRHATRRLEKTSARQKWLILISDAKPTDYDRYEGRYGIRDVRKAVQEAKSSHVGIRCLSVEKAHRLELAEMFGSKGYELLPRPDDLPVRFGALLRDLVKRAR